MENRFFFEEESISNERVIAIDMLRGEKEVEIIGTTMFSDLIQTTPIPAPKTTPAPSVEPIPYQDYDGDGIIDAWDQCRTSPETFNGYLDSDGCPDTKPKPKPVVPKFVDPKKGAQHYLDRYHNEPAYRQWFVKNYPDYTIEQVIELAIPDVFTQKEAKPELKAEPDIAKPEKEKFCFLWWCW